MEEQIWLNAAQAVLTQIGVGAGLHYMDIWTPRLEKLKTKGPLLISIL